VAVTSAKPRGRDRGTSQSDGDSVADISLDVPTYKHAVYGRLRDLIGSFALPPGERLVEADLANRLNVSKTPVREAIALLESDGLVEVFPYRGAIVRWLSVNEMLEQGYLVDALEMPAYPMVVERITDKELAAVRRLATQLARARRKRDEQRFGELAVMIHSQLFACTGFPRLLRLIQIVLGPVALRYDRILAYPFDDTWDVLTELSVQRVEAVRARDAELAREVVRSHRAQLQVLTLERVKLPEIARYFRD
jgi:DNA-binding GntR family transcriptional regulator